jgi:hypothetical protein
MKWGQYCRAQSSYEAVEVGLEICRNGLRSCWIPIKELSVRVMELSESDEEALEAGLWRCRWELWAVGAWRGNSRSRVTGMSVRVMELSVSGEEALEAVLRRCRWELWSCRCRITQLLRQLKRCQNLVKMLGLYRETCMISGFRREVDENCALLGYYAASSGNSFPAFRDKVSGQS